MPDKLAKRVLILDDNVEFRSAFARQFKSKGFFVVAPPIKLSKIKECFQNYPTDIFLDVSFNNNLSAKDILNLLIKEGIKFDNIKIWIVSGLDSFDVAEIQHDFPSVQSIWFGKPLDIDTVISVFIKEDNAEILRIVKHFKFLPIPLRIINSKGKVVYANQHWGSAANRPDPDLFTPFSSDNLVHEHEFWGPLPNAHSEYGSFKLKSFSNALNPDYLFQIYENIPKKTDDLREFVEQIFQTMNDFGFTRGRYYSIIDLPYSDPFLELKFAYKISSGFNLPIRHLLDGLLLKQVKYFERDTHPGHELLSKIWTRDGSASHFDLKYCDDCGASFWDEIIDIQNIRDWLMVPILRKDFYSPKYSPVALLLFDRLCTEQLIDGKPSEIQLKDVKKVSPVLRKAVDDLTKILQKDEDSEKFNILKKISEIDQLLLKEFDHDLMIQSLLDSAVNLTNASGGILALQEAGNTFLNVKVAFGSIQKHLINVKFDVKDSIVPAPRCFSSGTPIVFQTVAKELKQAIVSSISESVDNESAKKIHDWVFRDLNCIASLPINSGDKMIGVLTLHFSEPCSFTNANMCAIETLLQRAKWFLSAIHESIFRDKCLEMFFHNIRTCIAVISPVFYEIKKEGQKYYGFSAAQRRLQEIDTLSLNILNMTQEIAKDDDKYLGDPRNSIESFLDLFDEYIHENKQNIVVLPGFDVAPCWDVKLKGSFQVSSHVIQILLHNALKFGGTNASICISASIENGLLLLSITNPGEMSDDEDVLKFTPLARISSGNKNRGSHIGLHVARSLAIRYDGSLYLDNGIDGDGNKIVTANLRWPHK